MTPSESLSRSTFRRLASLLEREAGIRLHEHKYTLVVTRLTPRLRALGIASLDQYCRGLEDGSLRGELAHFVDRLTTNETYFFREPSQLAFFADALRGPLAQGPLRIWSAACSSGEELYSIAMVVDDVRGASPVQLLGSDISGDMLARAARAIYPDTRLHHVPARLLQRYFMRGKGERSGQVRVVPELRRRAEFVRHNLLHSAASRGRFDVIWLRNVLIYFEPPEKQRILEHVTEVLKPGGMLFVGLSESLHGHRLAVTQIGRSIYRRSDEVGAVHGARGSLRR
jgi:chemotaxis protein methyltransferase CheR